jgi:predicted ribosome quality control (RQC) complex YloA/Tae2 family protein
VTLLAALLGARIQRVDAPEPDLLALELGGPRVVLLLSTHPSHPEIGVPRRPRGGPPTEGVAKLLRNRIEGARIENAIDAGGGAIALDLRRGDEVLAVVHEALAARSNVLVLDAEGRVIAALHPDRLAARSLARGESWSPLPGALSRELPSELEPLLSIGAALLEARGTDRARERRRALDRALRRAETRMARRADATREDITRAAEAPALRERAGLLLANLHAIPRGAAEIELPTFGGDPPTIRIPLDVERGPRATADALFARARKLDAGIAIARARHDDAVTRAAAIAAQRARLLAADDDLLPDIERAARALDVRIDPPAPRRRETPERSPFRRYIGHGDRAILVGRTSTDNDTLTFRVARPHDLWLHVRGAAGSHVVIPLARGEACPSELLIDAAQLAAHFSTVRGEPLVEVVYTPRKHLRRPKGAAPGLVIVTHERSIALRVEPDRLARLLAIARDESA